MEMSQPVYSEGYPRLYTAGAMRWVDSEDSYWRRSVEGIEDLSFFHPDDTYFDHGGDFVSGAVSEDVAAINAADGVVAYISETPQIGTIVEILHAVQNETPVLVLIDAELSDESVSEGEVDPVSFRAMSDDHWFLINYLIGDSTEKGPLPEWVRPWNGHEHATVQKVTESERIPAEVEAWAGRTF